MQSCTVPDVCRGLVRESWRKMAKQLIGTVVSTKQTKTVVVDVERKFAHPLYKKIIKRNKHYQVHNEDLDLKVGDRVVIEETRPISKMKRFRIKEKIEGGK